MVPRLAVLPEPYAPPASQLHVHGTSLCTPQKGSVYVCAGLVLWWWDSAMSAKPPHKYRALCRDGMSPPQCSMVQRMGKVALLGHPTPKRNSYPGRLPYQQKQQLGSLSTLAAVVAVLEQSLQTKEDCLHSVCVWKIIFTTIRMAIFFFNEVLLLMGIWIFQALDKSI